MVLVLALAAAAIYGVVFFLKRAARPREQNNPHLKVLTSAHLGSSRFVHVISVGSHAWLVGTGEGGVSLIAEINDKEAIDAMLLDESRRSVESAPGRFPDFRALLRRLGARETSDGQPFSPENLRRRRERLKGL
jgi:flagellar protein FliO/FliZ